MGRRVKPSRYLAVLGCGILFFLASTRTLAASDAAPSPAGEDERLRVLARDIETLQKELRTLADAEQGLLGELKALDAEVLRRREDLARVEERIHRTEQEASTLEARAEELDVRLARMREQVARRLGALYRLGRPRYLRVLLSSEKPADIVAAYRTAAALSSRDSRLMRTFREDRARSRREAARLAELLPILAREQASKARAAGEASRALYRKRTLLRRVHTDRSTHEGALSELQAAAQSVGRVLAGLPAAEAKAPGFDRFRGLLDWPAPGPVSTRFGRSVNRRFGTAVVHSGVDIDAPFGAAVRSVHDGTVVFAKWFRGYGLTVIVDHGGGWLSVYAHASALFVEKGEEVRRGQKIAAVGDSGSIRGPYLYFEIRKDGRPVDPEGWLRAR